MEHFQPMHAPAPGKGDFDRVPTPHKAGRRANKSAPYDSSTSPANRLQPAHVTGRHALPFVWTTAEIRAERFYRKPTWQNVVLDPTGWGRHVDLDKIFGAC